MCTTLSASTTASQPWSTEWRDHSFHELLETDDASQIAPGISKEELLGALRIIYPPEKESPGAVAIELELIED